MFLLLRALPTSKPLPVSHNPSSERDVSHDVCVQPPPCFSSKALQTEEERPPEQVSCEHLTVSVCRSSSFYKTIMLNFNDVFFLLINWRLWLCWLKSRTCKETNGEKPEAQKKKGSSQYENCLHYKHLFVFDNWWRFCRLKWCRLDFFHLHSFIFLCVCLQAAWTAAAGLAAHHPIRAGNPWGQVLWDRGDHGNTERTQSLSAKHAHTGKHMHMRPDWI